MASPGVLDALPEDALLHALDFLERRDLARFGRTSKEVGASWTLEHAWRERLKADFLWDTRGRETSMVAEDAHAREVYADTLRLAREQDEVGRQRSSAALRDRSEAMRLERVHLKILLSHHLVAFMLLPLLLVVQVVLLASKLDSPNGMSHVVAFLPSLLGSVLALVSTFCLLRDPDTAHHLRSANMGSNVAHSCLQMLASRHNGYLRVIFAMVWLGFFTSVLLVGLHLDRVTGGSALLMAVPWLLTSPCILVGLLPLRVAMRMRVVPAVLSGVAAVLVIVLSASILLHIDLGGATFPLWAALIPLFALCFPIALGAIATCIYDAALFVGMLLRTTDERCDCPRFVVMIATVGTVLLYTVPLAIKESTSESWSVVLAPYVGLTSVICVALCAGRGPALYRDLLRSFNNLRGTDLDTVMVRNAAVMVSDAV